MSITVSTHAAVSAPDTGYAGRRPWSSLPFFGVLLALMLCSTPAAAKLSTCGASSPATNEGPAAVDLRSPPNSDGPTPVSAGLFVEDLRDLDAVASSFRFRGIVTVNWCDPRLAFDPLVEGVEERIFFGPEAEAELQRIFNARGFPVNQVDAMNITERVIRVRADGSVNVDINVTINLIANYDLRRFPFDRQRLELVIQSFLWDAEQVEFVADASTTGFADSFDIPEWTIEGVRAEVGTVDVIRSTKPFSQLVLTIDVKRKAGFYLWKVMLPLFIIVALSWSIFWMLDEKFGIRVRTSATGILTVVAYQFVAAQNLPRVGYLTLIDKVMVISFLLLAVTVFESYLVSRDETEGREMAHKIDRTCRWLFPLTYATLIALAFITTPGHG